MSDRKLQVVPLGGLGEFGMNIMALRYGDDIIVIDCGMMFPEAELLGVDIVTPDLTYLVENREHVRALFLTHAHEDHIGAVPYFLAEFDVPKGPSCEPSSPCRSSKLARSGWSSSTSPTRWWIAWRWPSPHRWEW